MSTPLNLNPFGDTSTGLIGKINNAVSNATTPSKPLGVQAKAPNMSYASNFLPANQVKTESKPATTSSTENGTTGSSSNLGVLSQQHALNVANAGTPGYTPLKEDGIAGPLTQAALAKYGSSSSATPSASQLQANTTTNNTANYGANPTPTNADFTGAIGGLINSAQNNYALGQKAQDIAAKAGQEQADIGKQAATTEGEYTTGMISPRAQGLAQNVAQTAAAQQQAVQQGAQTALTGNQQALAAQGQTQSGLSSAGSLAQPTSNIININPETGNPINGQTLPELARAAGQVSGIQSGAAAQAAASGNIAAQNATALGTAATGANAKSISDFTNQINTTQKSVQTLNSLKNQIVPGMGVSGFNPTSSPVGNQTFQQYFTEKNPAAKAGIIAGLGEIKNQISNVIASSTGLTPTGVTSVADTYDLTALNPQQLSDFLDYINQYAQSNLKAAQDSITAIQNGGTPQGNPGPLPAPIPNTTGQAAAGTGATLAEGFINKLLSQAGNAIAGGVAGIAASILQ